MRYEPHEYQTYATSYVESHPQCALLLDCGLGKTAITLTALSDLLFDSFEAHRVLVVAPLRVGLLSWPGELHKWDHLGDLTYAIAIGTEKERLAAIRKRADITIVNRENLEWLIERSGEPFDYDTVVLDELSGFKNGKSKRFRALMKVRPFVKRIVGLTGTPAGNGLMDLWAEYKCLDMGRRLGRFITHYREQYFLPDKRNGMVVFSYKPKPFAEEAIYDRVSDITISMRTMEHLEMPDLIETEREVEMSDSEASLYRELEGEMVARVSGEEVSVANAAVLCNKLLQMANGAIWCDSGDMAELHSRKLDALEDIVEEAVGKPILVAYWFRHDLKRISELLTNLGVEWATLDKKEDIGRWNRGELQVGLIHPASAGHGLNLQDGGSTLVWFGLTWSLELYQQTVARLWRQGQSAKAVAVIRIVTKGTMDEDVIKAIKGKDRTQSRMLDAVKARMRKGGGGHAE